METGNHRLKKPQKLSEAELERIAQLDSNVLSQLAEWANKRLNCSHCKKCTFRCEVLEEPALDIGLVEEHYQRIVALAPEDQPEAVQQLVQKHPELYHALRRCCFCGYCTAPCKTHMLAPDRMREWRELFRLAGLMPPEDKLVMVDNEWHIFSAYRAIHGIEYPEFVRLSDAAEQGPGTADTLFFPGCSIVSYAPELTRKVGNWLNDAGLSWAMSDDCCGSPLMSAGLFDRAKALREKLYDQIQAAGITRVLTICPGCGEELAETFGDDVEIVPLAEVMLEKGDAVSLDAIFEASGYQSPASITVFDSCHDRLDNRHGIAIRRLMRKYHPQTKQFLMSRRGKGTLCCGAGGAVATYDAELSERRVWRVIDEGRATGAETLVTMCPTCTYTIGQACLGADPERGIDSHHYLELLFGEAIDWATVFAQLGSMWAGEYGPWLNETFFE